MKKSFIRSTVFGSNAKLQLKWRESAKAEICSELLVRDLPSS